MKRLVAFGKDITEMQEDLECELAGTVYFGDVQSVPFSSAKQMEIYNEPSEYDDEKDFEEESYTLEFVEVDEGIKLIAVY